MTEPILGSRLMFDKFENTLKRVISFFFYKRQAEITPSYNALLNRWEKLWFPKEMTAYDIAVEQQNINTGNMASYSTIATAALLQFHSDFATDKRSPLIIDEHYLVPLGKNLRLEGSFDLVLRDKDNYTIIKWSTKQRKPHPESMTLDFAALKLAFEHRSDQKRKASYYIYDLGSTTPGFVQCFPSDSDVRSLNYWADQTKQDDMFIPRRGYTVYCRSCPYDTTCKNWEFPVSIGG